MTLERMFDAGVALLPAGIQPLVRRIDLSFFRFATVGAVGFIVDLIGLTLLVRFAGWTPVTLAVGGLSVMLTTAMQARFVSVPIAVASTWALNRNWTFGGNRTTSTGQHRRSRNLSSGFPGHGAVTIQQPVWP